MSLVTLVWMLVEQDGGVLMARRKAEKPPFPDLWVLPGDIMRDEESTTETMACWRLCPMMVSASQSPTLRFAATTAGRSVMLRQSVKRPLPSYEPERLRAACGIAAPRQP